MNQLWYVIWVWIGIVAVFVGSLILAHYINKRR